MSLLFGNFESEVNELIQKINFLARSEINTLDQLKNGIVISKVLANYLKKDKIEGILFGHSKEICQCNWELILYHSQPLLPEAWKTIRAYEILSDPGLLFSITKVLLQKLGKPEKKIKKTENSLKKPEKLMKKTEKLIKKTEKSSEKPGSLSKTRKPSQLDESPSKSIQNPEKIWLFKEDSKSNIPESSKTSIHTWLVDLQVIPPVLYLHEFLYRIRTGISLADLINRLEGKTKVIHGIQKNPKNSSYCIANINKTLEYLRQIPKVKSQFLWSSLQIYEGSERHIYGLLLDIKEFYKTRYPNFIPCSNRKPSINLSDPETTQQKLSKKTQLRQSISAFNLSSSLHPVSTTNKESLNIQKTKELESWLESLKIHCNGLSGETLTDFKTGEKLIEILQVLERTEFTGVHFSPKTTAAALTNIRKALEFLYKKPAFDSKFLYLDDEILNGKGKVIRSLLIQIKKIYKNSLG